MLLQRKKREEISLHHIFHNEVLNAFNIVGTASYIFCFFLGLSSSSDDTCDRFGEFKKSLEHSDGTRGNSEIIQHIQ